MKRHAIALLTAALLVLTARAASAHQDGTQIVGYSGLEPGRMCNTCHTGGTQTTVTIGGPDRIRPGATGHYTVTIANPEGVYGGVDIAPDNAQAKVAPGSATLVLVGNEVVHRSRVPFDKGELTFAFDMTAPPATGVVTLFADAVEGHIIDTPLGDTGQLATFRVTVDSNAPATADSAQNSGGCSASPARRESGALALVALVVGMGIAQRRRRQRVSV
jgi:hypothetical protein